MSIRVVQALQVNSMFLHLGR